jgi:hypothetical protein
LERYHRRLITHFRAYKARHFPGLPDGVLHHDGVPFEYAHILPKERFELNILPSIRAGFWRWFELQNGNVKLRPFFHHLSSPQALCFNLFFPFLTGKGETADPRLLHAIGMDSGTGFRGQFETVLGKDEHESFDFRLEGDSGGDVFFELRFSETDFGGYEDDELYRPKLEPPFAQDGVDPPWFDGKAFSENYRILRSVSCLGQHPANRLFFIFPAANESLTRNEAAIAKIAAEAMGTRVVILYLEVLVERIRTVIEDDPALLEHFEQFEEKYLVTVP